MVKTGAAYFGNRFLAHAERDLDVLSRSCDYVVHTLSEADLFYNKKALEKIFNATRRRKMEVWADPWGLGGVFGGEALSRFLVEHPDETQVLSNACRAPAACLNSRLFRDFVKEWVWNASELGAQYVFWDEPHFFFHWDLEWEGVYSCVCRRCAALFKDASGKAPPGALTDEAKDFRRKTLKDFLSDMMGFARKKGLKNALCLYAFDGYAEYERIWNELAALKNLDVFGCDPYWRWPPRPAKDPAAHVGRFARRVRESAGGKGSQIWLQAMRLPMGKEPEIERAARAAAAAGVSHLAAWSFDGGALLDTVLSEDPARVWACVARAFQKVRR